MTEKRLWLAVTGFSMAIFSFPVLENRHWLFSVKKMRCLNFWTVLVAYMGREFRPKFVHKMGVFLPNKLRLPVKGNAAFSSYQAPYRASSKKQFLALQRPQSVTFLIAASKLLKDTNLEWMHAVMSMWRVRTSGRHCHRQNNLLHGVKLLVKLRLRLACHNSPKQVGRRIQEFGHVPRKIRN